MPNSMSAALPQRPNLEHLKKQAKELLTLARNGDAEALGRLEGVLRRSGSQASLTQALTLSSAQHVVAQSYGFGSWALLKAEVLRQKAARLRDEGLPEDREQRMDLLLAAIEENDPELVRVLVAADRSLAEGWAQRRPLQSAAERDLPAIVDVLIDAGASFEPDHGWPHTPLSWSITTRSIRAARRLAERGAPLDLWCAAGLGDVARMREYFDGQGNVVQGASRHGATRFDAEGAQLPKPPSDPRDVVSDALYIACRNGELEAARFLLDRGADPAFEGFARAPALHWAAFSGNAALVAMLLERGADPAQKDGHYAVTYRRFAVRNSIEWSWLRALKHALDGDPSLVHERDAGWGPPLHEAALKGLGEHVQALLDAGADPRALDHAGRTALECARLAEDPEAAAMTVARLQADIGRR